MNAKPITRRSERRDDGSVLHLVIWEVDTPVEPCWHPYKYRLAYVVDDVCVVRYDNERGKGDHRHVGDREESYEFRLLPGIIIPTGEGLPFVGKARQSEHSRAYVTFGATQQTGGKTSQGGINISRNSLSTLRQLIADFKTDVKEWKR